MQIPFHAFISRNKDFGIMLPRFYLKYAVFEFKMSSWVKSDPPILTGSRKLSWSQNLRSLSQKTKNRGNYVITRTFGR